MVEVDGVQLDVVEAVVQRAEGVGDAAGDALRIEVQGDVQAYVLDVGDAVAWVAGLVAGQSEGAVEHGARKVVAAAGEIFQ